MVQEFYILRCCTCNFFQVHIVKKARTWACKMCGFKQSVIKVYGQGSAKECRLHVQKLNGTFQSKHEMMDEEETANTLNTCSQTGFQQLYNDSHPYQLEWASREEILESSSRGVNAKRSKWSCYLDEEQDFKETHVQKKSKLDFHTDTENEHTFLKGVGNRDSDGSGCNFSLKLDELGNDLLTSKSQDYISTDLTMPVSDALVSTLDTTCKSLIESKIETRCYEDFHEENDTDDFTLGEESTAMKETENRTVYRSSNNSSYLRIQISGPSKLFSTNEEDIDSILDL